MAYVFYAAIHRALKDGKVKPAAPMEAEPDGCDKKPGTGIPAGRRRSLVNPISQLRGR